MKISTLMAAAADVEGRCGKWKYAQQDACLDRISRLEKVAMKLVSHNRTLWARRYKQQDDYVLIQQSA
jgi:hypothetical protein